MAARSKTNTPGGSQSAGIYSDMSADGPEIGTLVVIVDRAKNLPNRKSIGKQDPYCAARLGKEAKKTDADLRGGQTPKWDQELRFTVHDSPDYYQLKVSVFHDDKKTELIGEAWLPLQKMILPGGGQNDGWHNLNCKGKYAGEILLEITYYDTRPKQEKAAERIRQGTPNSTPDGGREPISGPRQQKATVKRRPLPSDPTEGSPSPSGTPDYDPNPPPPPQRSYHTPTYAQSHSPLQAIEYNTPPQYIQTQQPIQVTDYSNLELRHSRSDQGYPQSSSGYRLPSGAVTMTPDGRLIDDGRYDVPDLAGEDGHSARLSRHDELFLNQRRESHPQQQSQQPVYELPITEHYEPPSSPGGPPPPPPVHRSNQGSPATLGNTYEPSTSVSGRNLKYDAARQDSYRHSMPPQAHGLSYQGYTPPRQQLIATDGDRRSSQPRHHSYDDRYNGANELVQSPIEAPLVSPMSAVSPTATFSPVSNFSSYHSAFRNSHLEDSRYDGVPPPAPLNLTNRGGASARHSVNVSQYQAFNADSASNASPTPYRGRSNVPPESTLPMSYSQQSHQNQRRQSDDWTVAMTASNGYIPPVPASLVPGMDPAIAQDLANRIYNENRRSYNPNSNIPSRSQYTEQSNYRPHPLSRQEAASQPFVPPAAGYDERLIRVAANAVTPIIKPRATSPDTRLPIRKPVSPQPAASDDGGRRLSGIPYGPDAYNALNPNAMPEANQSSTKDITPNRPEVDIDAKIIMHDGRVVDPSDHLPEGSWAPEPEVKAPRQRTQQPQSLYAAGGNEFVSTPGRSAGRPSPVVAASPSPIYMSGALADSPTPAPAAGRNRLQKKPKNQPPQINSTPLAPITPYQDNSFATRSLPRARTLDFAGENGYDGYSGSPRERGSLAGPPVPSKAPPIPAKVPINHGASPSLPEENAWALLEEMRSIDLGPGRARRRGHDMRYS